MTKFSILIFKQRIVLSGNKTGTQAKTQRHLIYVKTRNKIKRLPKERDFHLLTYMAQSCQNVNFCHNLYYHVNCYPVMVCVKELAVRQMLICGRPWYGCF